MPRISMVKGFKLGFAELDEFLMDNGVPATEGSRIFPNEMEQISKIFRAKGADCDTMIFRAGRRGFENPRHVFVCCDWIDVFAEKKVDGCLTKPVPAGFDEIRKSFGVDSEIGTFIVFDEEEYWAPEQLKSNELTTKPPCELCCEPTESWDDWAKHRQEKHGVGKDAHPLPEY